MKNLNIFSIMYFSFAENTNGMIKKYKLAVRWSYFQHFLFKLKSMGYEFYVFSWLWLVLPHHVGVKLKYVEENMGKLRAWWVWRRWEQVWSWVSREFCRLPMYTFLGINFMHLFQEVCHGHEDWVRVSNYNYIHCKHCVFPPILHSSSQNVRIFCFPDVCFFWQGLDLMRAEFMLVV